MAAKKKATPKNEARLKERRARLGAPQKTRDLIEQKRQEVIRAARADFLSQIVGERGRQIQKWGDSFPEAGFDTMAAVLSEEAGEVSRAILDGDRANLGVELIQTAAVCCRMYEQLARGEVLRSSNKTQLAKVPFTVPAVEKEAADALANLLQTVEQLIPEPSARGVADVVLFQGRSALKRLREAGAL